MQTTLAGSCAVSPGGRRVRPAPAAEGISRFMRIAPGSGEWHGLGIDKRLEGVPHLASLIRGGKATLVLYDQATSTCREKARAGGIGTDSVIKVLCCEDFFGGKRFLVASTDGRRIDFGGLFGSIPEYEYAQVRLSQELPPGMAHGTCTPFLAQGHLAGIEALILEQPGPGLGGREVDVAIGGTDDTAHRLAVRMRYGDLVDAIIRAHAEKVRVREIPRAG